MVDVRTPWGIVTYTPDELTRVGAPAPDGYIDRQAWAEAQMEAGLRTDQCQRCGLHHFPQEQGFIPETFHPVTARRRKVPIRLMTCLSCSAVEPPSEDTPA